MNDQGKRAEIVRWWSRAAGAALLLVAGAASAGEPATVATIDACMRANIPPSLQIKPFTLNSTDRNGATRTLRGRLYLLRENELLRSVLRVESPLDLRGASYLLREGSAGAQDAMYVFLPALNKTRRIMGGSQDAPLFGTDLSYADLKQISHAFSGGAVELEGSEQLDTRDTWKLKLTPDPVQQSRYAEVRAWIDHTSCVALRADFIEGSAVRKRYLAAAADLRRAGSSWYAAKMQMRDLAGGSHTELLIDGVASERLPVGLFNPHSFQFGN